MKRLNVVNTPTLFLSGLADTLIPPKMMLNLYQVSFIELVTLYCSNVINCSYISISDKYKVSIYSVLVIREPIEAFSTLCRWYTQSNVAVSRIL